MKRTRILLPLFLLLLALCTLSVAASAADSTVVFLATGGSGDGSSAESPVGTLTAAYDALDLTKDCTVVLCGKFTQEKGVNFTRKAAYTGSVTLTSVYGGVDYRESGAVYEFNNNRFYLYGETTFENMHFNTTSGAFLLVVARHNKVTVGEGVTITGAKLNGGTIPTSFSIIGGYQDEPNTAENNRDTDITVLSGSKIYVVAFARGSKGATTYTGTAHIKIGGNADVSRLHLTGVDRNNVKYGTTVVEITGGAKVGAIYGATQQVTANALELRWNAGSIGAYEPLCSTTPNASLTYDAKTVLQVSDTTRAASNFDTIAALFDTVECIDHTFGDWTEVTPATFDKAGEESRTCAVCGKVETRVIPAITAKLTVFLADGGSGDGSSAESPVGTLAAAYDALDLTKDCTVVLCGKFTQEKGVNFTRKAAYTGSVTLTSVYGGVDYRESGAVYEFNNNRFYLYGETTFENMHFNTTSGAFLLVVARHNKVTVGEGVTITGAKLNGGTIPTSFSIIGGYQDEPNTAENNRDTDITVLSGSKIYVVAFARGSKGATTYTGTAHIKIGGNASVSSLLLTGADRNSVAYGTTKVEITDNATVGTIYGATQKVTLNSLALTWRSGTLGKFVPALSGASIGYTNGALLKVSDTARAASNFATIAALFDTVECIVHTFGDWTEVTPATFGVAGEETRTCEVCGKVETREIPAVTAKLTKISVTAATDKAGVGTIRLIAKLSTTADANVTAFGIFVAKTEAIGTAKVAEWTETAGSETTFALDLSEIPAAEQGTALYAWALADVDGAQIALPLMAGASVNTILSEMGA